jgi:hypothetical protein
MSSRRSRRRLTVPVQWGDIETRRRRHRWTDRSFASVYFIEADGLVKIGTTVRDPRRAVATMTALGDDRRLLAVMPNAGEQRRHELQLMFARQSLGGDWFERSPELDAVISAFAV